MMYIVWDRHSRILVVAAGRSLKSVLRRMDDENVEWVVVVRVLTRSTEVYYYAFRSSELRRLSDAFPERKVWPVERAIDAHEWTSSSTSRSGCLNSLARRRQGPSAGRVVDFAAGGSIAGVGEMGYRFAPVPSTSPSCGSGDAASFRSVPAS